MTELKVPAVAESITEVTLSKYLVKDGDYVELDQPICELETDKASQEIPATIAGVVKFVAKEGDDLKVGALICNIDESAAKPEGTKAAEVKEVKVEKTAEVKKPAETTQTTKPVEKKEDTKHQFLHSTS